MLEAIRNRSNGPIAKFIIGLIIIPFAFAGVYSYFNVNSSNTVATVNGEDISLRDFDRSYQYQQQNWGENFDKYFNTDERLEQFRSNVLQQLINQRLSSQAINDMGLRISDEMLRGLIMKVPDFQDENGNFDVTRYTLALNARGFSAGQYQGLRKNELASSQFVTSLQDTNFVLKNETTINQQLENQTRDIEYLLIQQDFYSKQVDLNGEEGEASITSYYELNKGRFSIPEKVSIEYVYLSKRNSDSVVISDGQISDYYNDNISSFESGERRHLAHILVNVDLDADQEQIATAEKKINLLAERINNGESFETVAKEASEDTLTAELGGDLDWIEPGMMDTAFEDAAFSLANVDAISSVVKSDFGYHLIKLLDVDDGSAKPVSELKNQIVSILKEKFIEDKFYDLKENVSDQAFEYSDSLTEVASGNDLSISKTNLFDRQFGIGLPPQLQGEAAVLESAFSDDILYQDVNSELIELSNGNAVIIRLLEHQEEGTSPLEEVKQQLVTLITSTRAREATEAAGIEVINALESGESTSDVLSKLPTELPTTWTQQLALGRQGTEINAQLRNEVFKIQAPETDKAVYKGLLLTSGDYAVVALNSVTSGIASEDEKVAEEINKKFTDFYSQSELVGYLKLLDAEASISRSMTNANLIQ